MTNVLDPHVITDQSIDFSTVDRLLTSLVKEGMSDEEKVLAVFHAVRRMFVHGPSPNERAFDFHKIMHVFGSGSCLRQPPRCTCCLRDLDTVAKAGSITRTI
jgi:hypothetical protein